MDMVGAAAVQGELPIGGVRQCGQVDQHAPMGAR